MSFRTILRELWQILERNTQVLFVVALKLHTSLFFKKFAYKTAMLCNKFACSTNGTNFISWVSCLTGEKNIVSHLTMDAMIIE